MSSKVKLSEYAKRMLIKLVELYEQSPGYGYEYFLMQLDFDGFDLAANAGLISKELAYKLRQALREGSPDLEVDGVYAPDITGIVYQMIERGWALRDESKDGEGNVMTRVLCPTPLGSDYAHQLTRRWYKKALDFIKGDVRTVIVVVITTVIITILTNLIVRACGWR